MSIYTLIRHHPPIVYSQGITVLTHEFWDKPLNHSKAFPKNVTRASVWEEEVEARACNYIEGLGPCDGWLAHLWLSLVSSWSPKWQITRVPPRLMDSYLPDLPVARVSRASCPKCFHADWFILTHFWKLLNLGVDSVALGNVLSHISSWFSTPNMQPSVVEGRNNITSKVQGPKERALLMGKKFKDILKSLESSGKSQEMGAKLALL